MIPLIVRSHYSLMRGTASPEALCRAARRMGYDRLALTDTDNLYGLWPFLAACRREGIIPMVGAEITEPGASRRAVCLAADRRGYAHLCRLLTRRHTAPDFRLREDVADLADGLVVLAPDPELLTFWHGAGVRTAGAMGRRPLPRRHPLREAARGCGVPCVAVPDSFFLSPGDHAVHRLLRAIDLNTILSRIPDRETAPPDAWLAPPEAYERRFAPCPEAVRAAHQLADEIGFTGPDFGIVMPPWTAGKGRCPEAALREAAYEGARRRYGDELSEPVVDRLEHELKTIAAMGFSAYFLIVRDIVIHSPRTCGRGSGAASLVAYCLGVTNVCPVKHNLYFERFLHPGRKDPPDIDVDFAWDERDDVLAAVLEKHRGHAAMVANHVLFQPRMAVRETAKVYGLPGAEIGRVTERMPWRRRPAGPDADLLSEIAAMPEARGLDLSDPWPEIFALARRIIGAPRYLSVHPGGVVITPAPIDRYVPVERAAKGVPIIQWEKDAAEDAGLVKIDLLGNRSLGVIRDAAANVRRNGVPFEEAGWEPEDDPETQAMVGRGETMGCFYIESPATRLLQKKAKKGDFAHMVIHSSIIRPAANDYIREYLRRLHGGEWNPIHPLLSDVLDDTYGIMVYQEDVSRAAVSMAGFSHAEADGLRKVLSKKDRAHRLQDRPLRDYRERFFAGAAAKGVAADKTAQVWEMMMSFDGYSFCKPHSASYARVSFQAAWLKAHHPAEFMAAVIGNGGGFYSTFAYVSEARRLGLTVRPPDVNRSEDRWTGEGTTLRVGLMAVKGLSLETRRRIVDQRRAGPYPSLTDFLDRVRPDAAEARALIRCGAMDAFSPGGNRAALMWILARWAKGRRHGPVDGDLFNDLTDDALPPPPPEEIRERLRREFAVLGFLCDRHPIAFWSDPSRDNGCIKAADLHRHVGKRATLRAWLITGKRVRTQHGETMEFLTFEDETGLVETTFFPKPYARFCHLLEPGRPFLISGRVETEWGAATMAVEEVEKPKQRRRESDREPFNLLTEFGHWFS